MDATQLDSLSDKKRKLVEMLMAKKRNAPFAMLCEQDRKAIAENVESAFPLGVVQLGMLYDMERTADGISPADYHNVSTLRVKFKQSFDLDCFQRSVDLVVANEPYLRCYFDLTSYTEPLQLILKTAKLTVGFEDLRKLSDIEQHEAIRAFIEKENHLLVDVTCAPLKRYYLHQLADNIISITYTEPHALVDGWSTHLTIADVLKGYYCLRNGGQYQLEKDEIGYQAFVKAERDTLESPQSIEFWQQRIEQNQYTEFPVISGFNDDPTTIESHVAESFLDREIAVQLYQVVQSLGVSMKVVFQAVTARMMSILCDQGQVSFGVPFNGRPEVKGGVNIRGLFLNTLPITIDCDQGAGNGINSWADLINHVRDVELAILPHRRFPIGELVRMNNGQPLYSAATDFLHFHSVKELLDNGEFEVLTSEDLSKTDMDFFSIFRVMPEDKYKIKCIVHGRAEKYSYSQFVYFVNYYKLLLADLVSNLQGAFNPPPQISLPHLPQGAVGLGKALEQHQLDSSIVTRFVDMARLYGEKVAVICEQQQLSYQKLEHRANQLAHYLVDEGVKPGDWVGVFMHRSVDTIVSLLAILKAGGAYVPLDPISAAGRIADIVADAKPRLVLSESALAGQLSNCHCVCLDDSKIKIAVNSKPVDEGALGAIERHVQQTAYVIYTSGSTGKPKGVVIAHAHVLRLLKSAMAVYQFNANDVWTQFHSVAFDVSVWEIFGALLHGATLVVPTQQVVTDSEAFYGLLQQHKVTILSQTPSAFYVLLDVMVKQQSVLSVRHVVFGGEALNFRQLRSWFDIANHQQASLVNMYGITETTVHLTHKVVTLADVERGMSLIGLPLNDSALYICDRHGQLQPIGASGEIVVGGPGVAIGYHQRPELTAERFVVDKFGENADGYLYKSGDMARWLADGELEYLGRKDDQVKIRGFRIELGEIEYRLSECESVDSALVLAKADTLGDLQLVAYVLLDEQSHDYNSSNSQYRMLAEADNSEFARLLQKLLEPVLPQYMVPALYVKVDAWPLTANGKIDKRALPEPQMLINSSEYVAPTNEVEQKLVDIWAQLLKVEPSKLSTQDSLFDLGGHSILMIKLIAKMKEAGLAFTTKDIFASPTIAGLANCYYQRQESEHNVPDVGPAVVGQTVHSLPNRRMFCQGPYGDHFNTALMVQIDNVNYEFLAKAIYETMMNHEGMRHCFYQNEQGDVIESLLELRSDDILERVDLSHLSDDAALSAQIEILAGKYQESLNLHTRLHRFVLFEPGLGRTARFLCIVNHTLVDGYSFPIFTNELSVRYLSSVVGQPCPEFAVTDSLRQWSAHVHHYVNQVVDTQKVLSYWQGMSWSEVKSVVDFADGFVNNSSGDPSRYGNDLCIKRQLSESYSDIMLHAKHQYPLVNEKDIVLTAFVKAMGQLSDSDKVYFELFANGRNNLLPTADASRTIGFMPDYVPMVINIDDKLPIIEQVIMAKEQLDQNLNLGVSFNAIKHLSEDETVRQRLGQIAQPELSVNFIPSVLKQSEADTPQDYPHLPWSSISLASESYGELNDPNLKDIISCTYISVMMVDGCYDFSWVCRDNVMKQSTVERGLDIWLKEIELILDALCQTPTCSTANRVLEGA